MKNFNEVIKRAADGIGIRTHSGRVEPGDVFVAIPGTGSDGARFIPDALSRGAACVIYKEGADISGLNRDGASFISHPDPRLALGELASARFKTAPPPFPVVGVTGTNGKTTVAFMIEHLFRENGRKVGLLGTVNRRWPGYEAKSVLTTPDCWDIHRFLAEMRGAGVELAVMEVSSHALDQERAAGVEFEAAVMTNLTQDHLDYHKDMESYFQAKARLFTRAPKKDKRAVLNLDDPYGARLYDELKGAPLGFGLESRAAGEKNALKGELLEKSASGLKLRMSFQGESWDFASPLIGGYNGSNLLAAQGLGLAMGLKPEELQVLAGFLGAPGRLERIDGAGRCHVFVDYAHTPDALENVLKSLRELDFKRIITVFGCGGNRDKGKRPLMGAAVARYSDAAVLTSDNPRREDPVAIMNDIRPGLADCPMVIETPDRRLAISTALSEMRPGDAVLVAGKGHEDYQQIGDEKRDFSDQAVIREILG